MKNSVKEDWKRRMHAAWVVLLLALLFTAGWVTKRFVGQPFKDVLEFDRNRVKSISVVSIYDQYATFTGQAEVNEILDYIYDFRYSDSFYLPPRSGWTYRIIFEDTNGNILFDAYPGDDGILLGTNVYLGRTDYFAPFIDLVRI